MAEQAIAEWKQGHFRGDRQLQPSPLLLYCSSYGPWVVPAACGFVAAGLDGLSDPSASPESGCSLFHIALPKVLPGHSSTCRPQTKGAGCCLPNSRMPRKQEHWALRKGAWWHRGSVDTRPSAAGPPLCHELESHLNGKKINRGMNEEILKPSGAVPGQTRTLLS